MHFETVDRCMAKANSSESKNPSLLMSESFQIFPSTLFGNLDLTISDLAASNIKLYIIRIFYFKLPHLYKYCIFI
ncbi:hypothetical protein ALC57_03402 [Trachymyrmex cornetzi]|uniref:Uncharacterized protein n=1 Tax=Trachymyrmex cornetzi TaxID=471704 RepID=A0A195EFL0_9HYME|nr:hypothetical protein ALC57_03402 [Trachymyrmex cornetzi]